MSESQTDSPRQVAERLYSAFARQDGDTMAACYAKECEFSDPVFTGLQDGEVGAMWQMLSERAKEFSVTYEITSADDKTARVTWIANYLFSVTGRKVTNHVTSVLEVESGLIKRQRDTFDLYKWTQMALGMKGTLLGWLPPVQAGIRKKAKEGLAQWQAARFAAKK